jgi:16S rRNA (uracil1498-N3)-methyltransferase
MSKHRFRFIGHLDADGSWHLSPEDAKHCQKVLRLEPGERIELTDGKGRWVEAEIDDLSGKTIDLNVTAEHEDSAKKNRTSLILGALKPSSFDEILPSIVEIGIDDIHLFIAGQSEKKRLSEKLTERWQRIILSAVKQSKRSWVPTLNCYKDLSTCLKEMKPSGNCYLLHPSANIHLIKAPYHSNQSTYLFIGNEHGFNEKELAMLHESGCINVHIGGHILRATTACVAASSIASSLSFLSEY